MQNDLETYFIRHTEVIAIDDETRDRLWMEKRVAIHYPFDITGDTTLDSRSIDPNDYQKSAKRNIRALCNLAQKGGYVCAQYYGHNDCVLGFVEPQSDIEIIEGKWRDNPKTKGRVSDADQLPDTKDRIAVLKTIALTKVKLVEPEKHAIILVGRPRQGTLMRWPRAGKAIEELVEGRKSPLRLTDLSPARQETMCSEFLRMPEAQELELPIGSELPILKHLILPVGGTMKDIDIAALAEDGSLIYAQVTLLASEKALHKLQSLSVYGNNHLILFCRCDEVKVEKGVTIFPIDKVFEVFCASELGQKWLDA